VDLLVFASILGNSSYAQNFFLELKIITIYNQPLLKASDSCNPPNALSDQDVLIISGVGYDLFESLFDNDVVVFEGCSQS